jgi:hypothetical protein
LVSILQRYHSASLLFTRKIFATPLVRQRMMTHDAYIIDWRACSQLDNVHPMRVGERFGQVTFRRSILFWRVDVHTALSLILTFRLKSNSAISVPICSCTRASIAVRSHRVWLGLREVNIMDLTIQAANKEAPNTPACSQIAWYRCKLKYNRDFQC